MCVQPIYHNEMQLVVEREGLLAKQPIYRKRITPLKVSEMITEMNNWMRQRREPGLGTGWLHRLESVYG